MPHTSAGAQAGWDWPNTALRFQVWQRPFEIGLIFGALVIAGIPAFEKQRQFRSKVGDAASTRQTHLFPGAQNGRFAAVAPDRIHIRQQQVHELIVAVSVDLMARQFKCHIGRPGFETFFERRQELPAASC